MKYKKIRNYLGSILFSMIIVSCTDLTETVYDQIVTENYYNTKDDVIRAAFRPFEHAYWSIGSRFTINEETTDQLGTWNRDGWWVDGQIWQRYHYHTWTIDDDIPEWDACFTGIMQACSVLDDFKGLDPTQLKMTQDELDALSSQIRTLRAWFYIRLLDAYRNIPLAVSKDASLNSQGQVDPIEVFSFIETELTESLNFLPMKNGTNGNGEEQGQWNKAGAAALLVRLYLNAEKWIGKPMYGECAKYAQKIIDGEYGFYEISDRWDAPYDWNNETCNEVIFGFPGSYGRSHWHYDSDVYWWCLPANAQYYLGSVKQGGFNPKYAAQPSRNIEGNLYDFTLGMPVYKFQKYPEDYRLKKYKNLGNSTREGMFLFGYLEYEDGGEMRQVMSPSNGIPLYLRDQVGIFHGIAPGEVPENKVSDMKNGDHNSGWHFAKYPFYSDEDAGRREADYSEIRLAEIYYSLAECEFRTGNNEEAGKLLNHVRKRYYPVDKYQEYLYLPDGQIKLTENELIDEWGREFFAEGRRRTDLCRWNKFTTGIWWDKQPDADNHTEIFPLKRSTLNSNPNLVQNPGYDSVSR